MFKLLVKLHKSKSGSFGPTFAVILVPMLLVAGTALDYGSASYTKTRMQSALDGATLAITTLSKDTSDADRQTRLQKEYLADGGKGTATLNAVTFDADGTLHLSASASYAAPTSFMQLAHVKSVQVNATTKVTKEPSLVQATFSISKVSGYWNKTVIVYGIAFGATVPKPLLQLTYTYNGSGGTKGYGTTTVTTPDSAGKMTVVQQQQTCTSKSYNSRSKVPTGSFVDGNVVTTCTLTAGTSTGATIDVSGMDQLYLEMDVPSGNPTVLKSNDPSTSNRLYFGNVEVATGTVVNIFTAVPCGQSSSQAWEDGGNSVPADVSNADVFYTVLGKCDYSPRNQGTILTQ